MKKTSSARRVSKTERADLYQQVTDKIVAALENGTPPWRKPWRAAQKPAGSAFPVNAVTGKAYSGVNIPLLWMAAEERGFSSDRWLTYRQALLAGGHVRSGESCSLAVIFKPFDVQAEDEHGVKLTDADGTPVMETRTLLRPLQLFNTQQCEGLQTALSEGTSSVLTDEETETVSVPVMNRVMGIFNASGVAVNFLNQNRAYYRQVADQIVMPTSGQFFTEADYWSTLLHELVHASGHQKRLNREGITSATRIFGDPVYAFEELIVRRSGVSVGVNMNILDSWENPCEPDLPVPVMNRLKSQKGNGTIACQEKAQTTEAIVGRAGHRKMRMVKAKLPEPQSSEFYPRQRRSGGCNVVPCRYRRAMSSDLKKMVRLNIFDPASTVCPLSGGLKGRTGHLSASYLHIRVTTGSSKWARALRPTWRQSCHISQMPEVMFRTAIPGWMVGNERCRVTGPGVSADQVKGNSVCDSGFPTEGTC